MSSKAPRPEDLWPCLVVAVAILVSDQVSKRLAVEHLKPIPGGIPLPGHWMWLDYTENHGGAFGILQHFIPVFVFTGVVVIALIIWFWPRIASLPAWQRVAYGLVLGGTIGNLYDRLHQGYVVDFFDLRWFPVFNIADSAICVGLGLIALAMLRSEPPRDPAPPQPTPMPPPAEELTPLATSDSGV